MLENYRLRFRKLFSMINIWKHYIVSYFRFQEERYYEKLYKDKNRKPRKHDVVNQANILQGDLNLTSTIQLDSNEQMKEQSTPAEGEDNLSKLNILFFMEEMFLYMLEIMHSTAAMAYT